MKPISYRYVHPAPTYYSFVFEQTKADQCAAELAQVLRRERAGQGRIADAQAEVHELRGEMEHMREAFARSGVASAYASIGYSPHGWNFAILLSSYIHTAGVEVVVGSVPVANIRLLLAAGWST